MKSDETGIIKTLVKKGNELLNSPVQRHKFTNNIEADDLLNDLVNFPHAFVLACIMDRQIKAERAWLIPYQISKEIGGFAFEQLNDLILKDLSKIFADRRLHRFNENMAKYFYKGIQKIFADYESNASLIWSDKPSSATVVRRFLEFEGVGVKIATMATNSLARDFKVPLKDYICIDISPDIHVKRVFQRLAFISKEASNEELLYKAKELYPQYPGIFDLSCWQIGRQWCRPKDPSCDECYLNKYCPKKID